MVQQLLGKDQAETGISLMLVEPGKRGKVTPFIKTKIIQMVACGFDSRVIQQTLRDEYDFSLSQQCICTSYLANPKIKAMAAKFQKILAQKMQRIPIARKTVRLLVIQKAINECFRERVSKREIDEDGNVVETMVRLQPSAVASLIKEARVESEGEVKDEEKLTMLDIIRKFTDKSVGVEIGNKGNGNELGEDKPAESDTMDSQGARSLEIL